MHSGNLEREERGAEKLFDGIMAKIFPNVMENMIEHIQTVNKFQVG